jgi:phosphoglycolate phosphatase-like HAD superfamily hydrolase
VNFDPGRLTAIVFDVDGTLYRQGALRRRMLLLLLKEAVLHPGSGISTFRALSAYRHAQELLRGTEVDGALADAHLRLACERSGQTEQVVAQTIARWMDREPLPLLERLVAPALRTLLKAARSRGLRLGVFSDYPAAAKLDAMRLTEFFTTVVSAQDPSVNRFKPHPSGLVEAVRRLGATAGRALYVGDRHDVDGLAARSAGVPCVIVGRGGRSRQSGDLTTVSNYAELHTMLFPFTG